MVIEAFIMMVELVMMKGLQWLGKSVGEHRLVDRVIVVAAAAIVVKMISEVSTKDVVVIYLIQLSYPSINTQCC